MIFYVPLSGKGEGFGGGGISQSKVNSFELVGCLFKGKRVLEYRDLGNCGPKVFAYCSKNMSASDLLSILGAHQMWSI